MAHCVPRLPGAIFLNVNSPFAPDVSVGRSEPSADVKLTLASGTVAPLVSTTTPEMLASPSAEDVSPGDFCEAIWGRGWSGRALLLIPTCPPLCWYSRTLNRWFTTQSPPMAESHRGVDAFGGVCKTGLAFGIELLCCCAATCEPDMKNAENNQRIAYNFFKFPPV